MLLVIKNNNSYDYFMGYTVNTCNTGSKYRLAVRSDYVNLFLCFHLICSSYVFKVICLRVFFWLCVCLFVCFWACYWIVNLQRKHKEEQSKFSLLFVINSSMLPNTHSTLYKSQYYSTSVIQKNYRIYSVCKAFIISDDMQERNISLTWHYKCTHTNIQILKFSGEAYLV